MKRQRDGEDTPELRAELAAVRAAIRRHLRQENHLGGSTNGEGSG